MEIAPNNINNTRLRLKRLTERGLPVKNRGWLAHPAAALSHPAKP